ncbi:RagB/SusD family nutrient uptake outer membrane protein [Pedobacter nanyangensis]|uniref:RagB/SusD family nutrient uptake outer membrane protein n=1 Tax=Pedobacter nanyangensis TaxID=1562389 RepID=UPI001F06B287|nr:RagB/SusD family nutrient uptake outer membrane protein [Pedobacter nanyangensis]
MMKKLYILLSLGLLFSSCKKFLETEPTDFVSPGNYFKTETDINTALAGVYDVLGKTGTYGRSFYVEFDLNDQWFDSRSTVITGMTVNNYTTSEATVNTTWELLYDGVKRANIFLENVDRAEIDTRKKNIAKGEAMFLRAYYYFLLCNYWGDVPLRTTSVTSAKEVNFKNTPSAQVYDFVVTEMEKAADLVDISTAYSYNSRITKTVVWGILARVNLKMAGAPLNKTERYAEARKWAKMVIDDGKHKLNPDYENVFIKMCRDEYDTQYRESMWEVEFNKISTGGQEEEGSVGSINGIANSDRTFGYSYGVPRVTQKYFDSFEPTDSRRDWNIGPYSYGTVNGVANSRVYFSPTQIYNRFSAKWRREYETAQPKNLGTTPINFPILRYADVLLMFAEADNEVNGPTQEAIDYVEMVRKRGYAIDLKGRIIKTINISAGGSGYTAAPTVNISGGGGTGATAVATISNGSVNAINIISRGAKFTTVPTITFSGGAGTGAAATAVLTELTDANIDRSISKPVFKELIRAERNRELGYEGLRKFDLVRWGEYLSTMENLATEIRLGAPSTYKFAATGAANVTSRDVLVPIPSREIMLNKAIIQNKGW